MNSKNSCLIRLKKRKIGPKFSILRDEHPDTLYKTNTNVSNLYLQTAQSPLPLTFNPEELSYSSRTFLWFTYSR